MEILMQHLGNGLMLSLMLSLPCVLTAAGIGLVVGILQAVTQVQEQTIAAAPKILGVFLVILLGGGLMMTLMENYIREAVQIAFNEIPQDGKFILPPNAHQTPGQMRARQFFQAQAKDGGRSSKVQDLAQQWSFADEGQKGGTSVLEIKKATGAGNALGTAEKMALTKNP